MGLGENIKSLRAERGLTQEELGRIAGVSPMAVSQWENGRAVPRMGAVQRMADHFGISKSSIIDGEAGGVVTGTVHYAVTSLTAPVYGRISAGDALEMLPVSEEAYVIPPIAESHPDGFFLTVSGDSMDKIMPNGSLVYFDKSAEVRSGDIVAVTVNGDDATMKRIFFAGDTIVLHPESNNPVHRDRSIDASDPDAPQVRILGKAVWHYLVNDERL
ncbi:LexA family protein [Gordonibacter massiliensis (ex Traore et al. 2017)]|uniref:Helix-turn-helix domain-containing protein n=1 Tax=Gordonibacter massiliensis (ex Traore et al. 2017) TaxID=1841863 RepID=A0A842J9U4_9ACTN|nr:XRE family transcriptional regulator [Gordonibacter massiliensis (ex Traore et al. 2017)]MBC2888573.1 helix-turn-helix domain-containing protein [Gordonibacter massiliensis (ex Traore et al. 2017)]